MTALLICLVFAMVAGVAGVYMRIDAAQTVSQTAADAVAHDTMLLLSTSPEAERLSIRALAGEAPCAIDSGRPSAPPTEKACRVIDAFVRQTARFYGAEVNFLHIGPDVRDIHPATSPGRLTVLVVVSYPGPLANNGAVCGAKPWPFLCAVGAAAAAQQR